ncbi:MAG: hydroxymethylbilane synthase [Planctomycetes bacterium]|nr:hydroxymethylbilane synthase [Planctomycetota bacterium]
MAGIKTGTRGSPLAMAQANLVARAIQDACNVRVELCPIKTTGDRRRGSLAPVGGKGLFTAELEEALRGGQIRLAVHSAKDMPAQMADDLVIAAVPPRGDPRDAIVSRDGLIVESLPRGATVGTGSPRRAAQLLAVRGDLNILPLRGNVETRLKKALDSGRQFDAVILAMAGLERTGLSGKYCDKIRPLAIETMIPAAGQGSLVIQTLASDRKIIEMLARIDDADSHAALLAERAVLRGLSAGCQSSVAVYISKAAVKTDWTGLAMASRPDGSGMIRVECRADSPKKTGEKILESLLAKNADKLIA